MSDHRHHGESEHDEGDMAVPAVPGPGFVMVEPEFIFGSFEGVLNGPAMALDPDQSFNGRFERTPGGEKGHVAIGDRTPD